MLGDKMIEASLDNWWRVKAVIEGNLGLHRDILVIWVVSEGVLLDLNIGIFGLETG